MIATIHDTIENIALTEQLKAHGDKIKKDFKPIFELIPHINDLPHDYIACIKLKEAEHTIINRTYPVPRNIKRLSRP